MSLNNDHEYVVLKTRTRRISSTALNLQKVSSITHHWLKRKRIQEEILELITGSAKLTKCPKCGPGALIPEEVPYIRSENSIRYKSHCRSCCREFTFSVDSETQHPLLSSRKLKELEKIPLKSRVELGVKNDSPLKEESKPGITYKELIERAREELKEPADFPCVPLKQDECTYTTAAWLYPPF